MNIIIEFLKETFKAGVVLPNSILTPLEQNYTKLDEYGGLPHISERQKVLLSSYLLITKILIEQVLVDKTSLDVKIPKSAHKNLIIIASYIYYSGMDFDYFMLYSSVFTHKLH